VIGERKADAIAKDLLGRIVQGEIEAGELLPKEAELAVQYKSARSVVREAIKLLEVHKLVRPTRRLGTVALDPLASPSPDVVRAMLVHEGKIDLDVFSGWLELRAVLDGEMTARAAERRTTADVVALKATLADLASRDVGPADFGAEARRFGLQVARATQNPLYVVLAHWHALVVADLGHIFAAIDHASAPRLEGMGMVIACIEKREAERAKELVALFHTWATPRLLAAARLANGDAPEDLARHSKKPKKGNRP
jgi:DNA-binding FadR family transcriptional regulator